MNRNRSIFNVAENPSTVKCNMCLYIYISLLFLTRSISFYLVSLHCFPFCNFCLAEMMDVLGFFES